MEANQPVVRRSPSRRDNLIVALATMWLVGGLLLDAWAHTNKPDLESFWTPWHAVMYSGGAACILAIGLLVVRNVARGSTYRDAVPVGYEPAVIGLGLLAVSGLGDMVWHTVFGIEQNLRIFFSPTHITLIIAISLIASAPWRAIAADRPVAASGSWPLAWPAVLAGSLIISAISVITQFAGALAGNPLWIEGADELRANGVLPLLQNLGIVNLLGTVVVVTLVTGAVRRSVRLPIGAMTVMCAAAGLGLAATSEWANWETILALVAGGAAADVVQVLVRHRWFRDVAASASLGIGFAGVLVGLTAARYGLPYEAELWTGTVLWAGVLAGGVALATRARGALTPS